MVSGRKKKDADYDYFGDSSFNAKKAPFPIGLNKIVAIAAVVVVIIIVIVLASSLFSQKNNIFLFGADNEKIGAKITISRDGALIDSFLVDGNSIKLSGNPNEKKKIAIKTAGISGLGKTTSVTIRSGGQITIKHILEDDFFVDDNGVIHLTIDPVLDLNLEGYFDENTGEFVYTGSDENASIEFVLTDPSSGETTIIELSIDYFFSEFNQKGCIALSRSAFSDSTHYGFLDSSFKLKNSCESSTNLFSSVTWNSQRMGNVEIIFGSGAADVVLTPADALLLSSPTQDTYSVRVIFTPLNEFAGRTASFTVNFGLGDTASSDAKVTYEVALDNLEQCVKISPDKVFIPAGQSTSSLTIDVSSCASSKISFSLCENDSSCSGGTEGGIGLSERAFTLQPKGNSSKVISVSREEIPGVYGIPILASIGGVGKSILDEKLVEVSPDGGELLVPDKFVLSFMGGAKDSIVVRNKSLAEDVKVSATICSIYNSSLNVESSGTNYGVVGPQNYSSKSWWADLYSNSSKYAGEGKYTAALTNQLAIIDYYRAGAQFVSANKNANIKKAYLDLVAISAPMNDAVSSADKAVKQAQLLKDKVAKANELASASLASQIVSLISSIASLSADIATIVSINSAIQSTETAVTTSGCPDTEEISSGMQSDLVQLQADTYSTVGEVAQIATTLSQLYSVYSQIDSFTQNAEQINAKGALDSATSAKNKIDQAKEKYDKAKEYVSLALAAAAVDSFDSASKDDDDASANLSLAQKEMIDVNALVNSSLSYQLAANDYITLEISELPGNEALIGQVATTLVSLATTFGVVTTLSTKMQADVSTLNGINTAIISAATAAEASYCEDPYTEAECIQCGIALGAAKSSQSIISGQTVNTAKTATNVVKYVNALQMIYTAYSTYQSLTNDYSKEYANTKVQFDSTTSDIYSLYSGVSFSLASLPPAIDSANWLSEQEANPSIAAGYDASNISLEGDFDKERLAGLIGDAVINGFINGAYEGGVYTTKDTFGNSFSSDLSESNSKDLVLQGNISEDSNLVLSKASFDGENSFGLKDNCENTVELKISDYSINLRGDAKSVIISTEDVGASWDFSSAKVFDVYKEQEAGVVFSDLGLKGNSYGVVTLSAQKHEHSSPTIVTGKFGPFSVPDSAVNPVEYKYHFKFNVAPRTGSHFVSLSNNSCTNGLMRGENGVNSGTNTILSWDWNSVSGLLSAQNKSSQNNSLIGAGSTSEPFIDATQLSILLSKKLGSLNSLLSESSIECPKNPAKFIVSGIKPVFSSDDGVPGVDSQSNIVDECYLPFTTRDYDGFPALYYFLKENQGIFTDSDLQGDFEEITSAEEFLGLVDFNANLIRDGYGVDFQYDFAGSYAGKILMAGPSFLNPSNGAHLFFEDIDRAYFSSPANYGALAQKWALGDAGKYRVRMLIDFQDYPLLYRGGTPSAKIIFDLYSLDPVHANYSPLYYAPIDGFTGLASNNNRVYYGSSLSNGQERIDVNPSQGSYLSTQQRDSLVKLSSQKNSSPALLNSSPYLRSKVLEFIYNYSKANKDADSFVRYSYSTATPLLFELNGIAGAPTNYYYSLSQNNKTYNLNSNNLFLLSAVGDCTDLAGNLFSSYANYTPDFAAGDSFGVVLDRATSSGKTYLKTVAFSPASQLFGLSILDNGVVYSANTLGGAANSVLLGGISGMRYNDSASNSLVGSLGDAVSAVNAKSLCVSHQGAKEVFYWPENTLFFRQNQDGKSLAGKANELSAACKKN